MEKIIDLTHWISDTMPVYPESDLPVVNQIHTIKNHCFAQTKLELLSHHGTHIDAPSHMILGAKSLDQFGLEQFYGKALCINCRTLKTNSKIDLAVLLPYEKQLQQVDFVLLYTGWSTKWGSEAYFSAFPVLDYEACLWLSEFELKGIGLDNISIDCMESTDFQNHHIMLGNNILIIENLTNLNLLQKSTFTFSCLPIKYQNADGSPVRAVAIMNVPD
jgi:arylformamidase